MTEGARPGGPVWITSSPEETRRLGCELAKRLAPRGVLLLSGDLGAGKTVLAQGVAEGLGIDPAEIQSPTFTLIREHRRRGEGTELYHLDLYRLEPGQVEALGVEELLAGPGVKVVEWAERLPFPVAGALALSLRRLGEEEREIREPRPAAVTSSSPDERPQEDRDPWR
jgi:tRNA threonylcarbamoyladenosine biosynthesis protein TsaE